MKTIRKSAISRTAYVFRMNRSLLIMCLPAVFHVFIFVYLPMPGLILAFKKLKMNLGIIGSPWVGLKNFEFFFKSQDAWRVVRNTIGMNALFITVGLVLSVLFAVLLYEVKSRSMVKMYQTVMFLPYYLSWVVVSFMVFTFLNPDFGSLNLFLERIGLKSQNWYFEAKFWPFILLLISQWKGIGYGCVLYYAKLLSIDPALFEVASIDGASRLQKIKYISIPALIPLMTILSILAVGGIFRSDFGLFYQVTRNVGALYETTDVIDTYVFRALTVTGDTGMSTAVGLVQSLVGLILVLVTNFIIKKINEENSLF